MPAKGGGRRAGHKASEDTVDIEDLTVPGGLSAEEAGVMAGKLVSWYHANKRDLPWRNQDRWPQVPYAVWVSEIMLQQTRVATVIDYFGRWMAKWPTVEQLAEASEEEVNEMWSGLGYYRRARMLHQGAKFVLERFDGRLPRDVAALKSIPGIGDYTAGAIASIAFGIKAPIVDGNVVRVVSRLRVLGEDPKAKASVKEHWAIAGALVEASHEPGALNQGLMELGASLCSVTQPQCRACPLAPHCQALKAQKQTDYPLKVAKAPPRLESVAVCVLVETTDTALPGSDTPCKGGREASHGVIGGADDSKRFLLVQRPREGLLASLWEFPTVAVNAEASRDACKRALSSYLASAAGIQGVAVGGTAGGKPVAAPAAAVGVGGGKGAELEMEFLGEFEFVFSHIRQTLRVFCRHIRSRAECGIDDFAATAASVPGLGGKDELKGAGRGGKRSKGAGNMRAKTHGDTEEHMVVVIDDEEAGDQQTSSTRHKESSGVAGWAHLNLQEPVGGWRGSPPTNVRWVGEEELVGAALPTVVRRVLTMYQTGPTDAGKVVGRGAVGGKGSKGQGKRKRELEPDEKQSTLSHFFARSSGDADK